MINPIFNKSRLLFVTNHCPYCGMYKSIEKLNMELRWDKRIQVINCTKFDDFGVVDNPIILHFQNILKEGYPLLVWEGEVIIGANTEMEIIQLIKTKARNDFNFPKHIPELFNKECKYEKKFLIKRLVCN